MKVAIITDSHAGARNDSVLFHEYFKQFFDDIFFPTIEQRKIDTILHLGDLFHHPKLLNTNILYLTRKDVLERMNKYKCHILLGNHDCYFKNKNEVNSVKEVCSLYKNFTIYETIQEVNFDGLNVLFVPWIVPTDYESSIKTIQESNATVLMGHLQIAGFIMEAGRACERGLDPAIFNKFLKVFSGHFHHASQNGNIQYLGAPYEMTFSDLDDPKGFHIFDTDTLELEFIRNPYKMFYKIVYDDRNGYEYLKEDLDQYTNKHVKVVVTHKNHPNILENLLDDLRSVNPASLPTTEIYSLDVSDDVEDQIITKNDLGEIVMTDTLKMMNTYVDSIQMEIDKERLKDILREIYLEVISSGNE